MSRKAISPIISVLLLVVITSIAGTVVYFWTTTYSVTPSKSTNTGRIALDSFKRSETDPTMLTIYIRNIGSLRVTVYHILVNGTEPTSSPQTPFYIYPGSVTEVTLTLSNPFNYGTNLKISFDTTTLEQTISP